MTARPARQLEALTSLRFFAAAAVVLHHSRGWFGIPADLGQSVFAQGVSFFFVLSGFILTYVYPTLAPGAWRTFLWARFARIWPGHVAAFLLVVLALPASASNNGWPHTLPTILANLTLVHGWIPWRRVYFSYNSPSWSVSTEAFFYLAFPFLIRRVERTWMVKLGLALLLVIGLAAFCNRAGLPLFDEDQRPAAIAIMYINPLARLFEFVLGMSAAVVWRRFSDRFAPGRTVATLVELAALVLVVGVVARSEVWAGSLARFRVVGLAGDLWLRVGGISSFAFAALIVVMAFERGLVSRMLSHPLPVRLGEVSYAVYLLHQPLIRIYARSGAPRIGIPNWLAYTLFWAVLLACSHVMWSLIERPSRTWLVRHGPAARPAPVTPAAEPLAQSRR